MAEGQGIIIARRPRGSILKKLEATLLQLLQDIQRLLGRVDPSSQKWVLTTRNQMELRPARNVSVAAVHAYGRVLVQIKTLASFAKCEAAFAADHELADAQRQAGFWGSFDLLLHNAIRLSAQVRRGRVSFDGSRALSHVRDLRQALRQPEVTYEGSTRILGLNLASRRVRISSNLQLVKLSRAELNQRQPFAEPYLPYSHQDNMLLFHPTEAQAILTIPIDHSKEMAFFATDNTASSQAYVLFQRLEEALLLVKGGLFELGPRALVGGITGHGTTVPHPSGPIGIITTKLLKSEEGILIQAFRSGFNPTFDDDVLSRAVHRFAIGRKRRSPEDRVVDLVVAWETLLLTEKGQGLPQELSYRFSLNGSSLLHKVQPRLSRAEAFEKMSAAYAARSRIVHGASSKVPKELKKGNFSSLEDLCVFLEEKFRAAVLWLALIPKPRRPYIAARGWHDLLWSR